jgi:hypothetical protein
MTSDLQQTKHPVSAVFAGRYGHPLHTILVTVPIGACVASLGFDLSLAVAAGYLGGFRWRRTIDLAAGTAVSSGRGQTWRLLVQKTSSGSRSKGGRTGRSSRTIR